MGAERERVQTFRSIEDGLRQASDWYLWGPYVSERQWGTVREDYSADGEAWAYLPHDHARSRAYRWGEDGLAGFCDVEQRLCLGLALWNGRDPILKERAVRADRRRGQPRRGRQGVLVVPRRRAQPRLEPVALPLPAGARSRTRTCVAENGRRGKLDPEYELLDTGAFDDDRYWIVEVDYAKADPTDLLMTVRVTNAGPGRRHAARAADGVVPQHLVLGRRRAASPSWRRPADGVGRGSTTRSSASSSCSAGPGPGRHRAGRCCSARTRPTSSACTAPRRPRRTRRTASTTTSCRGAPTVNPDGAGTQVRVLVPADRRAGRDRRAAAAAAAGGLTAPAPPTALGASFDEVVARRRAEADEFYAELTPADRLGRRGAGHAPGVRRDAVEQAALLLRRRALAGRRPDPAAAAGVPARPAATPAGATSTPSTSCRCPTSGSTRGSPRGTWPSTASRWPTSTRRSPSTSCSCSAGSGSSIPNGALPAYEWDFGDVNPPVQAWAALEVFAIDGGRDLDFLSRVFDKLLVNFTWWVNLRGRRRVATCSRAASSGSTTSARSTARTCRSAARSSSPTPPAGWRSTRWPWARIAIDPQPHRPAPGRPTWCSSSSSTSPRSASAMDDQGLWDDADGLYYDRLVTPDGTAVPVKVRSMVGHHPAAGRRRRRRGDARPRPRRVGKQFAGFLDASGLGDRGAARRAGLLRGEPGHRQLLLGVVGVDRLRAAVRQALRRGRVPLAVRPAGAVGLPPRAPLRARRRGHPGDDRLRAGRVDHGDVRRQLQLARPDLVPAQLPRRSARSSATTGSSATTSRRVPDRVRRHSCRSTRSPPTCATG